ncbi:MAG: type I DNA topoisomerase [Candidatus Omnitrophica bacterium]|nr:type I DNA topoisomerase [Candidatus Omnitrophota bacterium]
MVTKKTKSSRKKAERTKSLVIVESPAKSKTINKILGNDFKVMASMGHIMDLPADRMGIDFENGFKPEYQIMKGRKKYLSDLKKEAKTSKAIYLAADPDREGEAICWHLQNYFSDAGAEIFRVSFEEITEKAVKEAFTHPGELDMNKVNAQQARRVLDRIVGYSLSPLLWGKITRGLSAGRVQSVAVRLIAEREEAIRNFTPVEYWNIDAILKKKEGEEREVPFTARLIKHKGEKFTIPDRDSSSGILETLKNEAYVVADVSRKEKKSYPRSPYTTSVLQQDAFNKLNFSSTKTMKIAQGLYEGVELGEEGSVGLITYMRTDSVRISDDAVKELREHILSSYGDKYCPAQPIKYRSKKRAQEAHEAIRPTLPLRPPQSVLKYLNQDEFKLYTLIWKRFVSSQMESAVYSVLAVNINAGEYTFRAGGAQLIFDGFLKVYGDDRENEEGVARLPHMDAGEGLDLIELKPEQHFTKPPARFTEASLVKALEEDGIGRPSTYAPIIRTIIQRNYVKRMGKALQPTELGELVNNLLVDNFSDIVNVEFTAKMEGELDAVEEGDTKWAEVIKEFYSPFIKRLEDAQIKMKSVKKQAVATDQVCEMCGKPMVIKWGRRGRFLSCSGFPACRNAKSITTGVKCPVEGCEGELVERKSSRGSFYGCTKYPKCTYTSRKLPREGQEGEGEAEDASGPEEVE